MDLHPNGRQLRCESSIRASSPPGKLSDELLGSRGQDLIVVRVAVITEPQSQELLKSPEKKPKAGTKTMLEAG